MGVSNMKRRLIKYEVFDKIQNESLSKAESELIKAESVLAKALNTYNMELHCYSESDATYRTLDGSYIHATYKINDNNVVFENIEELVIDEQSSKQESKKLLSNMVEELIYQNSPLKAEQLFGQYMSLPNVRREFMEGVQEDQEELVNEIGVEQIFTRRKNAPKKGALARKAQNPSTIRKRAFARSQSLKKRTDAQQDFVNRKRKEKRSQTGGDLEVHIRTKKNKMKRPDKKKMKEWNKLVENVYGYLEWKEFGPIMSESKINTDERGNIVALRIPTSKIRNESKILQFNWKTLNHEVKVLRNKVKTEAETQAFAHAMNDLRKANALSDTNELEKTIEAVVARWPNILYMHQDELAENVKAAFEALNVKSYDDEVCTFLAEGILRKATEAYQERVERIMKIAGVQPDKKSEDLYEDFQKVASEFYQYLDENNKLETQMYVDLYNSLVEVHKMAAVEGNELVKSEADAFLRDLYNIVENGAEPDLELAEEVAGWLYDLIETNLDSKDWDVSNRPYHTVSGEHPDMEKKAKVGYSPASDFSGDFKDPAPVSDGAWKLGKGKEDAEEMRNRAWGNIGNDEEVFPAINNPYVPKAPSVWKMKGEPNATDDGDNDWSRYQSNDTWPNLNNPNVPKGETPQSYKAKTDNLVVDA